MIFGGQFVSGIDLIDISLWTFTLFFFGLIFYLRREDRREGYPLEADTTGRLEDAGGFWYAAKKTFTLPHMRGTVSVPHGPRDTRSLALARTAAWPGAPFKPTGDPMRDGVGPASFAQRQDVTDLTDDGRSRIVPFRLGDGYTIAPGDLDPRGLTVYGGDGAAAGKVVDLWIDRSEAIIRYFEVEIAGGGHVLLPVPFAKVNRDRRRVEVDAIFARHFDGVPRLKSADSVTRLEEDKIAGYYGGGKLYAAPSRTESLA
jgi:photosynthetic reaction center H subunit